MESIYIKAFTKIPKLYLYTLPITAVGIFTNIPNQFTNVSLSILLTIILIITIVIVEYYKNCLIINSTKKTINAKKALLRFPSKFKSWILSAIFAIWQVAKWLLSSYILFTIAITLLIQNIDATNNLTLQHLTQISLSKLVVLLILIGSAFYLFYRGAIKGIKLFFTTIIALDSKKTPKESLAHSEKITKGNLILLIKCWAATGIFSILVFNLLYMVGFEAIDNLNFLEKIRNWHNYLAILIINISNTYGINIVGLVYKQIK